MTTTVDRFDHAVNLGQSKSYRGRRSPFWPPDERYELSCLDLGPTAPDLGPDFRAGLAELGAAIDAELARYKEAGASSRTSFNDPETLARALRRIGANLPQEDDRLAAELRARAIEGGYTDDSLQALAKLEENIAVVAGRIATWYGKEPGGLPTGFAARCDDARQAFVADAFTTFPDVSAYLTGLHSDLRLGEVPAFAVTDLFFMAGEGNLHPKHIAYFLPEDEGVKRSPFKKTYYFGNTHRTLLKTQSGPLAARHLGVGDGFDPADPRFGIIPTLGVFGHELGHCVHRPVTAYKQINAVDRWASVVLQEVAADVFGILIFADVWAKDVEVAPADVMSYYLAECLRYVNRGLGHFPDSDGMFLQLSYLVQFGALSLETGEHPRLVGDPEAVLAGLRSLARVLADSALSGTADIALAVHERYGPANAVPMRLLIEELRNSPTRSIEYLQEHVHSRTADSSTGSHT